MSRRIPAVALAAMLAAPLTLPAQAPVRAPAVRGIGPFAVETTRGPATVRLLRRDNQFVWVDLRARDGSFVQTGFRPDELLRFAIPRPAAFAAADAARTPEERLTARLNLKRVSDSLLAFRDLPGIPANEALMKQARLLTLEERWRDALGVYTDLAAQTYAADLAREAALRAAICLSRLGRHEEVLQRLDSATLPDEDQELHVDLIFARADARFAAKRYEDALLDYLYAVVFEPAVSRAEVRALAAALPCYAELQDWEAVSRTLRILQEQFPDAPETVSALEWAKPFAEQLADEEDYVAPG